MQLEQHPVSNMIPIVIEERNRLSFYYTVRSRLCISFVEFQSQEPIFSIISFCWYFFVVFLTSVNYFIMLANKKWINLNKTKYNVCFKKLVFEYWRNEEFDPYLETETRPITITVTTIAPVFSIAIIVRNNYRIESFFFIKFWVLWSYQLPMNNEYP